MVLVGRGGVRLHEEVFLAGVRLRGRRAWPRRRPSSALDHALDGDGWPSPTARSATQLVRYVERRRSPLRARLLDAMATQGASPAGRW